MIKSKLLQQLRKYPNAYTYLKEGYYFLTTPYDYYLQKQYTNSMLLNTMRKSGSHYLMSILSNYFAFEFLKKTERLGFLEMKEMVWNTKVNSDERSTLEKKTGYSNYYWEHENRLIKYNNAKKIIHTYRNPLDLLVSRFFYNHKNRIKQTNINHPRELIDTELPKFIQHFKHISRIRNRENVLLIAYEDLTRNPYSTCEEILRFLEINCNKKILKKAIEVSDKKHVKNDEQRYGSEGSNVVGHNMTESFVRSGKIGEWKEYFTVEDISNIDSKLNKSGISLSHFILE